MTQIQTNPTTNPAPPPATLDDKDWSVTQYVPEGAKEAIKLSINIVRDFIAIPTKSGLRATNADCLRFIMLCKSRGLNPFEGDAFMIGYEGMDDSQKPPKVVATFSLITSHQAFLKRAQLHPEFEGMESGILIKTSWTMDGDRVLATLKQDNQDVFIVERQGDFFIKQGDGLGAGDYLLGGWASVKVKGKTPTFRRPRLDVFSTGKSRWQKDPAGMIVKVAEADALRSSFPTVLGGLLLAEEVDTSFGSVPIPARRAPLELPHQRTNLRQAQAPEIPPQANGTPAAAEPEPAAPQQAEITSGAAEITPAPSPPTDEQMLRWDMIDGYATQIQECTSSVALLRLGSKIENDKEKLGEEGYNQLKQMRHDKRNQLN